MKEGKDIDKLFKDGLENPDLPFNDLDWDNLEERLHPSPKRRIVPLMWLTAVAGIAAMLLVVFLLLFSANKSIPPFSLEVVSSAGLLIKLSLPFKGLSLFLFVSL